MERGKPKRRRRCALPPQSMAFGMYRVCGAGDRRGRGDRIFRERRISTLAPRRWDWREWRRPRLREVLFRGKGGGGVGVGGWGGGGGKERRTPPPTPSPPEGEGGPPR